MKEYISLLIKNVFIKNIKKSLYYDIIIINIKLIYSFIYKMKLLYNKIKFKFKIIEKINIKLYLMQIVHSFHNLPHLK